MRALVRDDEIMAEPWSQWVEDHLEWLTTARPEGDGYTLVEDYTPDDDGYIEINGIRYTKEELRSLIE